MDQLFALRALALRPREHDAGRRAREDGPTAPTAPLTGDALLAAVTAAMVSLHERYYHRAPTSAKSQLMGDDLLACVLGGVYTDVEKTLIELERATVVQENRSAFQHAMQDRFIADVQRLSGRHVLAFISNQHVGPDLEIELFVLGPRMAVQVDAAEDQGR